MKKGGVKKDNFSSLPLTSRGGLLFKVSKYLDNILIIVYDPYYRVSSIRYFTSEHEASDWIEFLIIQHNELRKNNF